MERWVYFLFKHSKNGGIYKVKVKAEPIIFKNLYGYCSYFRKKWSHIKIIEEGLSLKMYEMGGSLI